MENRLNPIITNREREILYLIAHEFNNREIAKVLYLSVFTINCHRKNLLRKFGTKNVAGLIRRSFEIGLLPMQNNEQIKNLKEVLIAC